MKNSRLKTLLIGLTAGVVYAFLCMLVMTNFHKNVSVTYIFVLPLVLGAIPVLFSTKEQLQAYKTYLLFPWLITFTYFILCYAAGYEGMLCLIVIMVPFLLLGTIGAFIFRIIKLKNEGKGTKLYSFLLLPLLILIIESNFQATDQIYTVSTSMEIRANKPVIWENIKNVKDIKPEEINPHFIHLIGIPKPLNGELDKEEAGGTRYITWEKGIRFEERITYWESGNGFSYDIHVAPGSIPPTTLDEHVMIGGKYFDVLRGGYQIDSLTPELNRVTLFCTYRVTTNLNLYSKLWADFILGDFNEMILEVIRTRSEIRQATLSAI